MLTLILQILISFFFVCMGLYLKKMWLIIVPIVVLLLWLAYKYLFSSSEKITEDFSFAFTDDAKYVNEGKVDVYCGSDLILPEDYDVMGSRNRCLKKGVGVGMGMSQGERNRIIAKPPKTGPREKLYCGDKTQLPGGYDRFGSLHECLMKGVGVGARMPENKIREWKWKRPKTMSKHEIYGLANRFKISTNQPRKDVVYQITREINRTAT